MMNTTAPLTVIAPIVITDSMVTSHSETETESAWAGSPTSYDTGGRVKHGSDHDAFSSLVDSNEGNTPVKWPDSTSYWYDEGKTNPWNMFDLTTNIQTVGTSPMTVVIEPGDPVTGIGCDGLECDKVTIEVSNGVETIYSKEVKTRKRDVTGWYTFFTEKHRYDRILIMHDLPGLVTDPVITVTFESASGTVKCGGFGIGRAYVIGSGQNNSSSQRRTGFSIFQRDEIDVNRVRLQKRGAFRELTIRAYIHKRELNRISSLLDDIDGSATYWSCLNSIEDDWYQTFAVRGVYKSPSSIRPMDGSNDGFFDIDIQGI